MRIGDVLPQARPIQSRSAEPALGHAQETSKGPAIRVLIFFDEEGWAWWHRARQIQKNVSAGIMVEIRKITDHFDHFNFDLILLFDAQLIDHVRHVPREKLILGSSCPMLTPGAMDILANEQCGAGLVNSLEVYRKFREAGKLFCCQNGVDTGLFHPGQSQVAADQDPRQPWVACWVGNSKSIGNKGLDLIRQACMLADVKLLAWDKAELTGAQALLSQEQVRDRIYHNSTFYICASESEGTPNPMLEALACGLPAVTTAVGNAPELIRDGYNGFLAERSVASLVEAILRLKACDRTVLSRQARQSILAGWTWKQQVAKYETAFTESVAHNRLHPGNPKNKYRNILWVDAKPPEGSWEPAAIMEALKSKYPQASISVCCEKSAEARYASCPGNIAIIPFDANQANADLDYRGNLMKRLQTLGADLCINGSSRADVLAELLVLGSSMCERVSSLNFLSRLDPNLQTSLKPLYTRLLETDPILEGTQHQAWSLLAGMGIKRPAPSTPPAIPAVAASNPPQPETASWNHRPASPRVLMVVHMFPPHWFAGVEVHTYHEAQALRAQGVDVSVFYPVIAPQVDVPIIQESSYGGIPVFTLFHNGSGADPYNIEHPVIDRAFTSLLDQREFDIVHFQHTICMSFRMIEIAKSKGARTCLTLHDFWMMCRRVHFYIEKEHRMCSGPDSAEKCSRCLHGPSAEGGIPEEMRTLERNVQNRVDFSKHSLRLLDRIVSPSRYLVRKFEDFGFVERGRIEVSALGLKPVPRLTGASGIGSGTGNGVLRFGFLGTIHPLKNVYLLAEAFKRIRGSATLQFFGMGRPEHVDALKQSVQGDSRISYEGKYGPEDLSRVLSGLDMVIVCSITENYPLVVREAMSAGVPVLASKVGGIPEIIDDGRTGLLFDPGDPGQLIGCIQSLVDNPLRIASFKAALGSIKSMETDASEWIIRYRDMVTAGKPTGYGVSVPAQRQ